MTFILPLPIMDKVLSRVSSIGNQERAINAGAGYAAGEIPVLM